jgi:1,4-dihydroxy-2-naphthoate octaprenyltransferase
VITCDNEGRIETFSTGAEAVFGYRAEEVVGIKRVSIFSPGPVVLTRVGKWLKRAREAGEYETRSVFLRKDGSPFAAEIRITPTYRDGLHVGYCGVTVPKPEVPLEEAMPRPGFSANLLRWVVILRLPFLSASLIAVLIGGAWAAFSRPGPSLSPWTFLLVLLGAGAIHAAANTFNDYFDWRSGTDPGNADYLMPFSGGSRAIELGLIGEAGLFRVAWAAFFVSILVGLVLLWEGRIAILGFGLFGAFSTYFYTAPPLRLVARKGAGELLIGLNFGVLMIAGTAYALTGTLSARDFLVGVPIGLLTTAILWINQFPDMPSDAEAGKNHLVVLLGRKKARWGYVGLLAASFAVQALAVFLGILPVASFAPFLTLPLAIYGCGVVIRSYEDRSLVRACRATVKLQMLFGLLSAAALYWS